MLHTGRLQIKTKSVQSGEADIDENYRETLPEVTEDVVIGALGGHNNEVSSDSRRHGD